MKNIEFKVRISEKNVFKKMLKKLGKPKRLDQVDYYFNHSPGIRFKVRKQKHLPFAVIIRYIRADKIDSKVSDYEIHKIARTSIKEVLKSFTFTFGKPTIVKKTRLYWVLHHTRVHLDKVDNLGQFIELETVLDKIDIKKGQKEIGQVIRELSLNNYQPVKYSYVDLIRKI